jgi:branched-chain amino acid transport system permease protein
MSIEIPYLAQSLANGLHNGMLYAALAYGYVLIYSVTKRANLAHGAVFAFAGQVFVMGTSLAYEGLIFTFAASLWFGLGIASMLCAILCIALGHILFPLFLKRERNMVIIATFAVAIVLMEAQRIGADTRDLWLPPVLSGRVTLAAGASITQLQLVNIVTLLSLLAAIEWALQSTAAGRILRATSDDQLAARLSGVDTDKVIRNTVYCGSALAMVAGILAVLYFGNMSFGAGLTYGLKVLFIASAGGFASPWRAASGAFLFGEAEALWDGYFPIAIREPVFFLALVLMMCLRQGARTNLLIR